MIAARRTAQVPARRAVPEVRVSYRRYTTVATRVLEVLPPDADPAGPRVVLLHGFCDNADTWFDVLGELARAGVPAVAVDLPALGEGPALPELDNFLDAVLLRESSPHATLLVGNSLGGTLSLRAAARGTHRDRIAGVVSVAAPGLADSWLVRAATGVALPARLWSAWPLPVPSPVVRAVAAALVPRLLYADAARAQPGHVERFTALFTDHHSTARAWLAACSLVAELTDAYTDVPACTTPALVVACGRDRLVTTGSGARLSALLPGSRLLHRPEWGHCPQLDDPASVARLVADFAEDAVLIRTDVPSGARPPGRRATACR
ncbi:hypothetical protein B1813_21540 [Saccharomonospora piscinae]|uniref:AB hydrolase-1 domain-containing protein n=1 Tax=Saccharomonospora piscinae TaxID=687388 RepID=A0A1V8ZX86_SACPI|nr:alpha/beta fold hydrolase [Saccharomonospora piscinae]OQO89515.1 hypothetical protein B1813_21540 [Saccharomonospora piscinae]